MGDETALDEQAASQALRLVALGRLTGGLAHDFNNLLGVISNNAHLVQRHVAGNPELAAPVAATLRAVGAGSRLTQHLTRLAGQRPVRPHALDLLGFLPELESLLGSVVGSRITLHVAVHAATRPIRVDSGELELALINLALDARDAMAQGGTIRLDARPARPEETAGMPRGDYVLVTLATDGGGMEPAPASRALEPLSSGGTGTGLGLSQVHAFALQAGGRALQDTTAAGATTVSLLLPAAEAARASIDAQGRDGPPVQGHQGAHALQGLHVLLVEDNQELGEVTATLLQCCGAKVRRAPDATAALALLAQGKRPDVVLSDIVMPGPMDGVTLAREIRRRDVHLPVVLISGYTRKAPPAGEFAVLNKPCTPDELVQALTHAVGTGA